MTETQAEYTVQRALEMTGGEAQTLAEAVDQWENERQALAELFDENQAITLSFRHFDVAMELTQRVLGEIERDAALFISPRTREKIEALRAHLRKAEGHRVLCRELVVNANERRLESVG